MINIGSWDFISYKDKQKDQNLIDGYFNKITDESYILNTSSNKKNNLLMKLNSNIGEKTLSILGSSEKDFNFYGDFLDSIDFNLFSKFIKESKVDSIKFPLLSKEGAELIENKLSKVLPDFVSSISLNSVSPILRKENYKKNDYSLSRNINSFIKNGYEFKKVIKIDEEIKGLHIARWGDNRSDKFFDYLEFCNKNELSNSYGIYYENNLVAYMQNMITGSVNHYYYSIFNEKHPGSGAAIMAFSIKEFLDNTKLSIFSFGRGAERYKYRWADDVVYNYTLSFYFVGNYKKLSLASLFDSAREG